MAKEIEKDWITVAGLRAVVLVVSYDGRRNHRCGYVAVPTGHPLFGVGYHEQADCISQDSVDHATIGKKSAILAFTAACGSDAEDKVRRSPDIAFDCHGGLTYSGSGAAGYPVQSPGWWFGFDCNHCDDGPIEEDPRWPRLQDGAVRDLPYVEAECESLATQLAAVQA